MMVVSKLFDLLSGAAAQLTPREENQHDLRVGLKHARSAGGRKMWRSAKRTILEGLAPAVAAGTDSRQQRRRRAFASAFRYMSGADIAGGELRFRRRRMALRMMRRGWRDVA